MRRAKGIFAAGAMTLCVLILFLGLLVVGIRSERMMTGNTVSYRLEAGRAVITNGEQTLIPTVVEPAFIHPCLRLFSELMRGMLVLAQRTVQIFPIA